MKSMKMITLALITAGACTLGWLAIQRLRRKRMLQHIAEEGYETAGDILYPNRKVHPKLHYGPVLPQL